jgi:hypothetical protein
VVQPMGTGDAAIVPCFIRLRDAPRYLGMEKNRFNRDVRPRVTSIRIGSQGIAFDRIDLDAWADQHKSRNGCPAAQTERSSESPESAQRSRRAYLA